MSWKTLCVLQPPETPPEPAASGLPFVFLDRSLGGIQVPRILRAAGVQLVTLSEHYGVTKGEDVQDTTWISETAERSWIAFMKDEKIRRRPAERAEIHRNGARCFCIANGNLKAAEMAQRYLVNLARIKRACDDPGPFLYAVHAQKIERLSIGTI